MIIAKLFPMVYDDNSQIAGGYPMFDFDKVIERRNTNCAKFDTAVVMGYPEDVLPLWVADMDFAAPPCVLDALHKAVDHGVFGYSILGGEYFEAIKEWFVQRFSWQLEKDWLVTTPGVVFALSAAVRAATQKGDAVLVQPPVYYPFYRVIEQNERRLVENPLVYKDGKYTVDFADFEHKVIANNVKLFILCSPHNPVCRVWTKEELQQIGAICHRHGVTVLSDEIHCDFAFPDHPHTPFPVACPQLAERTIICTAPSKSFNIAGLQVSNLFIPGKDLRTAFCQQMQIVSYQEPNRLGAIACTAAYQQGGPWLDACKAYMRENLAYVRNFLRENNLNIRLVEPEGTYFAWLDCSGLGLTKAELDDLIIHKAKLWLDSGSMFGDCGAQFQRMVLACPRATVMDAMDRLSRAINGL